MQGAFFEPPTIQSSQSSDLSKPESLQYANSLLWQIDKEGCHRSYLFGTCHLPTVDVNRFTPEELTDLGGCTAIITEALELGSKQQERISEIFNEQLSLKCMEFKNIIDKTKNGLEFIVRKRAALQKAFEDFKKEVTFIKSDPLDIRIKKLSDERKCHVSLDLPDEISELFLKFPQEMLLTAIINMYLVEKVDESLESLLAATDWITPEYFQHLLSVLRNYQIQNLNEIHRLCNCNDKVDINLKKIIFDERNNRWIERLLPLLEKEKCFIAVGAGHLVGKNGLIDLLRARGFTVIPIACPIDYSLDQSISPIATLTEEQENSTQSGSETESLDLTHDSCQENTLSEVSLNRQKTSLPGYEMHQAKTTPLQQRNLSSSSTVPSQKRTSKGWCSIS